MSSVIRDIKLKKSGWRIMIEDYNNAYDIVEDCKHRKITDSSFKDMQKKGDYEDDFEGVNSYQEALDLLDNGYQEPIKDLKASTDRATIKGEGKRISTKNDVVGFAPIVPLAMKGIPQAMLNTTMKPIKAKVIDLYYIAGVSASNSSDKMLRAGKKVIEALISLELQGYRVNLSIVDCYSDDYGKKFINVMTVKVKNANQPLDLKRISFPVMHSAFFRVIGFDWYSKFPKGKYISGYGVPIEKCNMWKNKDNLEEFTKEVLGDNAVVLSATHLIEQEKLYDVEHIKKILTGKDK